MEILHAFKFRGINDRLFDSLAKSELYFSVPEKLNDPFDCRVDIQKALDNAIAITTGEERSFLLRVKNQADSFLKDVDRDLKTYGIWSYSRELINPLMWAHYAQGHKGLCLTYELPEEFWNHELDVVVGVSAVDYEANPVTDWFVKEAREFRENASEGFKRFGVDLIIRLLTAKDECWKYEQENRLVARHPGPKPISPDALIQVCFGLDTPEADIDRVTKFLEDHKYTAAICRIVKDDNDFGLRVDEI